MSALCVRGLAQSSCQIRAVCVFLESGLGGPTPAKQLSLCPETDLVDTEAKYMLAEVIILVKRRVLATRLQHGGRFNYEDVEEKNGKKQLSAPPSMLMESQVSYSTKQTEKKQ